MMKSIGGRTDVKLTGIALWHIIAENKYSIINYLREI
jgi:hypothetical protein